MRIPRELPQAACAQWMLIWIMHSHADALCGDAAPNLYTACRVRRLGRASLLNGGRRDCRNSLCPPQPELPLRRPAPWRAPCRTGLRGDCRAVLRTRDFAVDETTGSENGASAYSYRQDREAGSPSSLPQLLPPPVRVPLRSAGLRFVGSHGHYLGPTRTLSLPDLAIGNIYQGTVVSCEGRGWLW